MIEPGLEVSVSVQCSLLDVARSTYYYQSQHHESEENLALIQEIDQAWCADITYIPFKKGFLYLVAIMDWHSRKVLSWRVSNTMTTDFCVAALTEALALYSTPDIFNTDQSAQFTSAVFTGVLQEADVAILMGGAGRALDNIFIERLWRTLKYDHIYLSPTDSGTTSSEGINEFLNYYNQERPHSSLNDQTPDEIYHQTRSNQRAP
jgi:putative transposase